MPFHFKFATPLLFAFAATTWAANVPKTLHDFAVKPGEVQQRLLKPSHGCIRQSLRHYHHRGHA